MLSLYRVYYLLTLLATPFLPLLLWLRLRAGKEDKARMWERLGLGMRHEALGICQSSVLGAELPTEQGDAAKPWGSQGAVAPSTLWIHAASMGESLSALPLIEAFLQRHPDWRVVVTTVTVTSARLMAEKLPAGAVHRFAPLDHPLVLRRFFVQWQPDAALWIESELWPNMVQLCPCPLFLVNARLSERSFRRWRFAQGLLAGMLAQFTVIFPQSEADAARFANFVLAEKLHTLGNLKYDAPPLECDEAELATLRQAIGARPVWLAASTHEGEEAIIAEAHRLLANEFPDILTLIVPRHAPRGEAIAAILRPFGGVAQRSRNELPHPETSFYLADTMGELGLFYRLSGIAFLGGSLVPHGGQNLLEAARLDCALLSGTHTHNFAAIASALEAAQALTRVSDASTLAEAVASLLRHPAQRQQQASAAAKVAAQQSGVVARVLDAVEAAL